MSFGATNTKKMAQEVNFYDRLELTRSADKQTINKSYRRLALEYHPDKSEDVDAEEIFRAVAEAYTVLSTPKLRAVYDTFGLEGLNNGAPIGDQGYSESWSFHGDARRVFREFFGGDNPFQDILPKKLNDEFNTLPVLEPRTRKQQGSPLNEIVLLTLEEAFNGCMKKMRVRRSVMNPDGYTSCMRDKILTINIKPGYKEGTKITFPKNADETPNQIPGDVVFELKYHPHTRFVRKGNDLHHTAFITLADALTGCIVELMTLDGRVLSIPVNEVVRPGYTQRVAGEGFPVTKAPGTKGDLILDFNVTYPTSIPETGKSLIRRGLALK
eukprot:m.305611 g.305611  ORF g.305611 m.305611 type:complete len:327 (+) comp20183_c0_seq3:100-1080(+)